LANRVANADADPVELALAGALI
jgi:hypothetical protein